MEKRLSTPVGSWARWFGDGRPVLTDVPHCPEHAAAGARIVVEVNDAEAWRDRANFTLSR